MTIPPQAPPPQQKKGLSPLAWVAIGCAALVVLAGVVAVGGMWFVGRKVSQFAEEAERNPALAAAKAIAAFNPEIEVVEEESDEKRITFRNTDTGETFVVDAEDVEKGRISFESAEGKVTVDTSGAQDGGSVTFTSEEGTTVFRGGQEGVEDVPGWVPRFPGAELSGAYTAAGPEGESGAFSLTTADEPRELLDWYKATLRADGYEIQTESYSGQEESFFGLISAVHAGSGRSLTVNATRDRGETRGGVQYSSESR